MAAESVLTREKMGFGAPVGEWLRGGLSDRLGETRRAPASYSIRRSSRGLLPTTPPAVVRSPPHFTTRSSWSIGSRSGSVAEQKARQCGS